ncbi:MAG: bifunctional oligoribonuclease/PAP phosphatase NrnA, partial [Anaerotardibacter sp.]
MLTPQSNVTLAEIASCIRSHNSFVLCGHVNPDGDCLGSQVAMAALLRLLGKEVVCLLAKPNPVEVNLSFLMEKEAFVFAKDYQGQSEVFIALDVPTTERLGDAASILKNTPVSLTIDHHACDTSMTDMVYVDPASPACCSLVWEVAKELDAIDETVALGSLTGLMTDTGRFAYQNTTPESFIAAAEMMRHGADPALISREFFQNRTLASYKLEQRMLERLVLCEEGTFAYSYLSQADFQELNAI